MQILNSFGQFYLRKKLTALFIVTVLSLPLILLVVSRRDQLKDFVTSKTRKNQICYNCNILLLDIDILRADELPCYGYFRNTAPNICRFAQRSVEFLDNHSQSNWTLPDMFSTITSLYPSFHKVKMSYSDRLPDNIPTLAQTLHKKGYQTILLIPNSSRATLNEFNGGFRGYDEVQIEDDYTKKFLEKLRENSKPWFMHIYRGELHIPYLLKEWMVPIDRKMKPPPDYPVYEKDFNVKLNRHLKEKFAEIFHQKAIDEIAPALIKTAPPMDTRLSDYFFNLSTRVMEGSIQDYVSDFNKPVLDTYYGSFNPKKKSDVAYIRMMYDTLIKNVDQNLKDVFDLVESNASSKKIITVLMSDHGDEFGEFGKFNHDESNHSPVYYTPLIINSPTLPAKRIWQPTGNIDIFPTLLDLTGIKQISSLQGKSLLPAIKEELNFNDRLIYAEHNDGRILQNKKWFFYLPKDAEGPKQAILYNKEKDPEEKNNVAELYPALTRKLFTELSLLKSYENITTLKSENSLLEKMKLSPEKLKRMKKEGYF